MEKAIVNDELMPRDIKKVNVKQQQLVRNPECDE